MGSARVTLQFHIQTVEVNVFSPALPPQWRQRQRREHNAWISQQIGLFAVSLSCVAVEISRVQINSCPLMTANSETTRAKVMLLFETTKLELHWWSDKSSIPSHLGCRSNVDMFPLETVDSSRKNLIMYKNNVSPSASSGSWKCGPEA